MDFGRQTVRKGVGSESRLIVGFGISGAEPSGYAIRKSIINLSFIF